MAQNETSATTAKTKKTTVVEGIFAVTQTIATQELLSFSFFAFWLDEPQGVYTSYTTLSKVCLVIHSR